MKLRILCISLLLIFISGCTQSGNSNSTANPIYITANGFDPLTTTINFGEFDTFINNDSKTRWVTSNLPIFDTGKALAPGESYGFYIGVIGRHQFFDKDNSHIKGELIVTSKK